MGIILDLAYGFMFLACWPMWVYRMVRHGRYRTDWPQRFGAVPISYGLQPTIWIHGVSLGEVNAARPLVDEIHSQLPQCRVVISSSTETGMTAAQRLYAPNHVVFRWPLDFTWAVRRAIRRVKPSLVVLMEGEAWPNFLAECNRRDVPAVVVNGRIGPDKGYPRYKRLGPLARRLFNRLAAIGVQDERYAEMFLDLGVDACKIHLTGMMKFDTIEIADHLDGQDDLARAIGLDGERPLWVAGGTGPGEEELILDAYRRLRETHPRLALAIVPRKPERFDEVAGIIGQAGLGCIRRSDRPDGTQGKGDAVILGDTMGELRKFYALAAINFVGRSLVPMGGSDMIESAALGKPTCFGPHTFNFPQADDLAMHGCQRVKDVDDLVATLGDWLSNPAAARKAGEDARAYVRSQQGATRRNVELLCHVLDLAPAQAPGQIATPAIHAVS